MPGISQAPECACHGESMYWNANTRYLAGGYWRCRAKHREGERRRYAAKSGLDYNRLLLQHRRTKALARRRKRETA